MVFGGEGCDKENLEMKKILLAILVLVLLIIGGLWVGGGFERVCAGCDYAPHMRACGNINTNLRLIPCDVFVPQWKVWVFDLTGLRI